MNQPSDYDIKHQRLIDKAYDAERRSKAKVEVKWRNGSDWEETYLVHTIYVDFTFPLSLCEKSPSDQYFIGTGYDGGGITIEYIGGNEKPAYDVRINEGPSAREQWDTGRCDGRS